jgi:hypothetical protein
MRAEKEKLRDALEKEWDALEKEYRKVCKGGSDQDMMDAAHILKQQSKLRDKIRRCY